MGFPQDILAVELARIPDLDFHLSVKDELRSGISCKIVTVHAPTSQHFRHLGEILKIIHSSSLKTKIKEQAKKIFTRLAVAEAKVHNVDVEQIHFHEVGAVDTIIDIVGTLIGLEYLGIEKIVCSPLPMGRGFVRCQHGNLPLPAPAVYELLTGIPVYGTEQEKELVTPTGAALAVQLADSFGDIPAITIHKVGYGAGKNKLNNDQPNLLRLVIGEQQNREESQSVEIIESNLDDWNTEMFPYLCEVLLNAGALDVSLTPILMKKGRPGHRLQVLADPSRAFVLKQIILSETSTIGLRFRTEQRMTLTRKIVTVDTQWGMIAAKQVCTPAGVVIYPEYEACKQIAQSQKIPLAQVYNAVTQVEKKEE